MPARANSERARECERVLCFCCYCSALLCPCELQGSNTLSVTRTRTGWHTLTCTQLAAHSLAGQKIKIVLVADYYCKNAHSLATYPHKAAEAEAEAEAAAASFYARSVCFCFVFPFFQAQTHAQHTHTQPHEYTHTHAVAAGMFQNV